MNQVLETERRAEAMLIEARKEAEAQRIRTDAEREMNRAKLEAERERVRITAEAERERVKLKLDADVDEAKALAQHPPLLKLRQLETLQQMARSGGRFIIGLDADVVGKALGEE